jgi:hypothetical protein
MGRLSFDELSWNKPNIMVPTAAAATPVFALQLAGLFHHPPAGDQTCRI